MTKFKHFDLPLGMPTFESFVFGVVLQKEPTLQSITGRMDFGSVPSGVPGGGGKMLKGITRRDHVQALTLLICNN